MVKLYLLGLQVPFCWGRPAAHMYGFSNASTRIMPIVTPQFVTLRLYWELEVTLLIFIVSMAWWIRPKATICTGMLLEWKLVAAICTLLGAGMHTWYSQAEGCWLTCLKNKIQTVKSNSIKASLWKPRYFIQLQISNNQAQALASRCVGAGKSVKRPEILWKWRLCSELTLLDNQDF